MYKYDIKGLNFKNGFGFNPKNLVVFIGPNNCGKSQILKDILKLTTTENPQSVLIDKVDFSWPLSVDELIESYKITTFLDDNGNHYLRTLKVWNSLDV